MSQPENETNLTIRRHRITDGRREEPPLTYEEVKRQALGEFLEYVNAMSPGTFDEACSYAEHYASQFAPRALTGLLDIIRDDPELGFLNPEASFIIKAPTPYEAMRSVIVTKLQSDLMDFYMELPVGRRRAHVLLYQDGRVQIEDLPPVT